MGVILTILLPFFYSVVRIAWKEQERDRCPIINAALVTFMWTIVFFSLFILCVDSQFSSHFYIFRCSFFIPSSQFGELVMMIDLLWNAFKSSHIPKLERERKQNTIQLICILYSAKLFALLIVFVMKMFVLIFLLWYRVHFHFCLANRTGITIAIPSPPHHKQQLRMAET